MNVDFTDIREYQRLVLEMLFGQFDVVPDVVFPACADGPTFARVVHSLAPGLDERHTTVVDALLMPRSATLGLGQIASSFIVAFNAAAQSVYLVCNGPLSEDALAEAARFKNETNMRVHLIDGVTLAGWVRANEPTLDGYPPELLDMLLRSGGDRDAEHTLTASSSGLVARLELGWSPKGRMAPCEVTLQGEVEIKLPPLIGDSRAEVVRQLVAQLRQPGGTVVFVGGAGVGKSTVLQHVADQLGRSGISVATMALHPGTTSRGLFLEILASIAGMDLSTFLLAARRPDQLERILAQVGGITPSPQMREAVASVVLARLEDYVSHRDLNDQLLIEYVSIAISPHVGRRRRALVFQDLNHAPRETVEFLHALAGQLADVGLSVLYEVRDTGEPHGAGFETEQLLRLLEQHPRSRSLKLSDPTHEEARQWLCHRLSGLGPERAEVVRMRVGNSPLFLNAAIDWMVTEGVVHHHGEQHVLVEDLERFFEGISPPTCTVVLDRLIDSFRRHRDGRIRECMAAIGLLDGELDGGFLERMRGDGPLVELIDTLLETSLFGEGSSPWGVASSHGLVLERIRLSTSRVEAARVATRLLGWLDDVQPDIWTRKRWRVRLLAAIGAWNEVVPEARDVARELFRQRQWAQSIETYQLVLTGLQQRPWGVERERSIVETGVEILEAELQRYRLGTPQCTNLLESTQTLIELIGPGGGPEWRRVVLRARLVHWKSSFVREHLEDALERGHAAMAMAVEEDHHLDDDLCGRAVCCLGVALKAIGRTQDSLTTFNKGVERFPSSVSAAAGRLSNLAATSLSVAPEKALEHIEALLHLVEGQPFPFSDYLHARVDRSMMAFLCQRYDLARELAFDGIRLSLANAVPAQEARARNILGCCRWVAGEVEAALAEFDRAAFASERSVSYRFLWRMRTNCALAALDAGKSDAAQAFARSAIHMVVEPRRRVLERLGETKGHEKTRWYVALLALGTCLHHLGDQRSLQYLYAAVPDPIFADRVQQCVIGARPTEVFGGSSHVHAGRIMMTG